MRGLIARLSGLTLLLAVATLAGRAHAIDVKCIEASKYKYLWVVFDGDPEKFAAYLRIDRARLPKPEHCRAALLTGRFEQNAAEKLISFVLANEGWLTTLYLSSGGGQVSRGIEIALVTRMFWLKTRASFQKPIVYEPDFLLPPLGFIPRTPPAAPDASPNAKIVSANWNKFVETIKPLPQPEEGTEPTRCASACAMAFSGGIDRQGIVRLHRPLNSGAIKDVKEKGDKSDLSLLTTMERLQRAERERTAVLEQMDPGESFIRATRMQPTNFTVPATATRTPSYVSDLMLAVCGSDAAQLQDLDTQTRSAIEYVDWNGEGFVDSERLRLALRTIYQRREQVEACVAALHEKERLKRFAEACKQQPCSLAAVLDAVKKQHRAVTAAARLPKSERKK